MRPGSLFFSLVDVVLDLLGHVEVQSLQRIQPFDCGHGLQNPVHVVVGLRQQAKEQVFLGVDVVVEAALEDPELVRDVLDRGVGVSPRVKDLGGGVQDLLIAAARTFGRSRGGLRRARRSRGRHWLNPPGSVRLQGVRCSPETSSENTVRLPNVCRRRSPNDWLILVYAALPDERSGE